MTFARIAAIALTLTIAATFATDASAKGKGKGKSYQGGYSSQYSQYSGQSSSQYYNGGGVQFNQYNPYYQPQPKWNSGKSSYGYQGSYGGYQNSQYYRPTQTGGGQWQYYGGYGY